jgi:hypothetical protein
VRLWRKIRSVCDPVWDEKHRRAPADQPVLGGRMELHLDDGRLIAADKPVADAQVGGARTLDTTGYEQKFRALTADILDGETAAAFLELAHGLPDAAPDALLGLNPPLERGALRGTRPDGRGIYDHGMGAL